MTDSELDYSRAMLAVYRAFAARVADAVGWRSSAAPEDLAGEVVRQLAEARTLLADALPHLPEELQERVRLSVLGPRAADHSGGAAW